MAGLLENRPPAEAIWAAQFFIGMTIGVYYVDITLAELRRDVLAGMAFMVILAVLAGPARLELEIKAFREQQRKEITLTPEKQKEE